MRAHMRARTHTPLPISPKAKRYNYKCRFRPTHNFPYMLNTQPQTNPYSQSPTPTSALTFSLFPCVSLSLFLFWGRFSNNFRNAVLGSGVSGWGWYFLEWVGGVGPWGSAPHQNGAGFGWGRDPGIRMREGLGFSILF